MHPKLAAVCERMHNIFLVREVVASHRLEHMHSLRLLENLAASRRNNVFDRSEGMADRQRRILGRVYSVDDPEHCGIDVYFEPRRPPLPQEFIKDM